jgi:protein TonB
MVRRFLDRSGGGIVNVLPLVSEQPRLGRFTVAEMPQKRDRLLTGMTAGIMALTLFIGGILMTIEVPALGLVGGGDRHRIRIRLEPENVTVPAVPEPVVAPQPEEREIPRLEPQTILGAPEDRPVSPQSEQVAVAPQTTPEDTPQLPPRRVYGVRKVYAKGLGPGGQGADGLVTKRGNTLDGVPDSLTATAADLQGELAALSTIDKAPEPVHRAKPKYSPAMRKARARGVVSAYLLVDVDGSVKDVKITADIGWDSRPLAAAALRRFRFSPALKDGQPVAVWILHRIRFEFQE